MSTTSCEPVRTAADASAAEGFSDLSHALIDGLPLPCALFDQNDGAMLASNEAFAGEFMHLGNAPDREHFIAAFDSLGEGDDGIECYAPHTRRWYRLVWRELPWTDGTRCNAVFANSISDEIEALRQHKAQQEQLLFTSRMLSVGEMATTLAHELNQPLGAIINYLSTCDSIIERGDVANPRLRQGIGLARKQAEHASAVIARLREFVRTRNPKREPHPLDVIAQTVVELLRLEAEQHQVRILTKLPKSLPRVIADRVMIEQVLLNLVKNAIDAMRETAAAQREIVIGARRDLDGMIEVRVRDHGPGIGPDFAEKMFAPLFSTKSDGLGMGLAICRSIMEFHEGRLFAEPNADGGSSFIFTLPAESA
jgi:C4-dicarboxylate-specific signal transduction histidine kinase